MGLVQLEGFVCGFRMGQRDGRVPALTIQSYGSEGKELEEGKRLCK